MPLRALFPYDLRLKAPTSPVTKHAKTQEKLPSISASRRNKTCFWQGSNLRPSACEADVITTTLQKLCSVDGAFLSHDPIWICDTRSHGSRRNKETDESTVDKDSSVPLMRHDPCDLGSQIQIRITPKQRTLGNKLR